MNPSVINIALVTMLSMFSNICCFVYFMIIIITFTNVHRIYAEITSHVLSFSNHSLPFVR